MAGGRPLKFKSVEELQEKVDAYFAECDSHMVESEEWEDLRNEDGKLVKDENGYNKLVSIIRRRMTKQVPYTITGLALALDTTRETLLDYQYKEEFTDTIKAAKLRCENFNEQMLYGPSPTGTIFNLKNNYGWKDKTEQDLNVKELPKPILGGNSVQIDHSHSQDTQAR